MQILYMYDKRKIRHNKARKPLKDIELYQVHVK